MNFLNLIFKTGGMMKKLIFVVIGLFLLTSLGYCENYGEVKDNNNGNAGYIFVSTGQNQGSQSIGHWTDPSFLKGDKGQAGEQGIQGIQGEQGIVGLNGLDGINGIDGLNGIDGINGVDGMNGVDGLNGEQGLQGEQGIQGEKGDKGDKGDRGKTGKTGKQGKKGDNGKDVDPQTVIDLQNTDSQLNTSIIDEVTNRILGDNNLLNLLGVETDNRTVGDTALQNNINTETIERKGADNILQGNINTVDTNSQNRDITLQNNLNTETTGRINGDNFLNHRVEDTNLVVDSHSKTLQDHEQRISNLNDRVGKLERTQFKAQIEVRILDTKRLTILPYVSQNFTRGCVDEMGVRIIVKIGKSYEEKLIEKTNSRLTNLEKNIGNAPVITKIVDTKGNTKSISISANGLEVNGNF